MRVKLFSIINHRVSTAWILAAMLWLIPFLLLNTGLHSQGSLAEEPLIALIFSDQDKTVVQSERTLKFIFPITDQLAYDAWVEQGQPIIPEHEYAAFLDLDNPVPLTFRELAEFEAGLIGVWGPYAHGFAYLGEYTRTPTYWDLMPSRTTEADFEFDSFLQTIKRSYPDISDLRAIRGTAAAQMLRRQLESRNNKAWAILDQLIVGDLEAPAFSNMVRQLSTQEGADAYVVLTAVANTQAEIWDSFKILKAYGLIEHIPPLENMLATGSPDYIKNLNRWFELRFGSSGKAAIDQAVQEILSDETYDSLIRLSWSDKALDVPKSKAIALRATQIFFQDRKGSIEFWEDSLRNLSAGMDLLEKNSSGPEIKLMVSEMDYGRNAFRELDSRDDLKQLIQLSKNNLSAVRAENEEKWKKSSGAGAIGCSPAIVGKAM